MLDFWEENHTSTAILNIRVKLNKRSELGDTAAQSLLVELTYLGLFTNKNKVYNSKVFFFHIIKEFCNHHYSQF